MDGKQLDGRDAFIRQLREALENFHDPEWLGEKSALAAPYFLEPQLIGPQEAGVPVERGNALCRVLLEAAVTLAEQRDDQRRKGQSLRAKLTGGSAEYRDMYLNHLKDQLEAGSEEQLILYWRFFHHRKLSIDDIIERVSSSEEKQLSRATFFRHIQQTIERFSRAFINYVTPAVRLESPPLPKPIVGRDAIVAACLEALRAGKTIALTGSGGIGKTTLGSHIVASLAPQPAFWFTLRPNLNDHLRSILFGLSRFLHRTSAGSAWRQLVADQGQVRIEMIESLIRHDLESLHSARPLLCFDELDHLQPTEVEAHAQILTFLESLRSLAPLLLIGQRLPVEADMHQSLEGLDRAQVGLLLARAHVDLSAEQLDDLHTYTGGNPRLLDLFCILYRADESLADLLRLMSSSPSLESLLNRVWQRLSSGERELIPELAVFRRHAPCDIWRPRQQELDRLAERNLAHYDGRGGVALLPAFRMVLYNLIPTEDREALHRRAAEARRQRGEFTACAYHYLQAGRPREAILLWHDQRVQEINQGQGQAALTLFNAVSISQVSGQVREKLVLLRGELQKRAGDYPAALRTLQLISWQTPILKMRAKGLQGDIYELQDQFGQAIKAYQDGLNTAATAVEGAEPSGNSPTELDVAEDGVPDAAYHRLPYRLEGVYFHKRLSRTYMRQRAFDRAWRESLRARYEVEDIQGMIQEHQGNYADALTCYRGALALAEACGHTQGEARTRNNLLRLLVLQGAFEEAFTHGEKAYQLFRLVGDLANQASVRVNQALGYNQAGQPGKAVELAEEALALFEQLGEPWGKAVAAQNLAEAHLALGNLREARRWVERVLREEETSTIPDALRTWGEIELAEGKYEAAERRIQESLDAAVQNKDTFLEAYAWRALGKVYFAQGKIDDAARSCDKAIALFENLGVLHEVASTQALGSHAQPERQANTLQMPHAAEGHDQQAGGQPQSW